MMRNLVLWFVLLICEIRVYHPELFIAGIIFDDLCPLIVDS